jgi:hypothetical protein
VGLAFEAAAAGVATHAFALEEGATEQRSFLGENELQLAITLSLEHVDALFEAASAFGHV